jgi:hypothetical protein
MEREASAREAMTQRFAPAAFGLSNFSPLALS